MRPAIRQHAREVRRVAGARAKVHRRASPAPAPDLEEQPLRIDRVRAPLETVKDDDAGAADGPLAVIDQKLVAIGSVQSLAAHGHEAAGADQASPDRLEVGARKPAGRTKTARIGNAGSQENLHPFLT